MSPTIFQLAFKGVFWFNIVPWFSLAIFVKNLTDKIDGFTRKPRDKNARSSHPEVFLEKGVLKICSKFTGEDPCRSAISILAWVFSYNFGAYFSEHLFLRTPQNHYFWNALIVNFNVQVKPWKLGKNRWW